MRTAYRRIRALPACRWGAIADAVPGQPEWAEAQALVRKWTRALARNPEDLRTPELRPFQAVALEVGSRQATTPGLGLVAQAGVGKGKTLAAMLLPTVLGSKKPVLMIPPALREQTMVDRFDWSRWYNVPPVHIVTYSALSQPDGTDLLRRIAPDLIICDEAHSLKNATAARSMRFYRALADNPECRVVAMTATFTDHQISDFTTLFALALRDTSPTPLPFGDEVSEHKAWAAVIDTKGKPGHSEYQTMALALTPEDVRGGHNKPTFRRGLQRLISQAPGVIVTSTSSADTPLHYEAVEPDLAQPVHDALNDLVETWTLPDGGEVVDANEFSRAAKQLSVGFFYHWIWPHGEDRDWLAARRDWNAALRAYLADHAQEWRDSPFLVESGLRKGTINAPDLHRVLDRWNAQRHKPMPQTEAVWLDYSPLVWAADWLESQPGHAILWYYSRAVGAKLQEMDVNVYTDRGWARDPRKDVRVALPLRVYGEGINLQAWRTHLVLEPMTSAKAWEQLVGRAHRQNQTEAVRFDVAVHTDPFRACWFKALARAHMAEDTLRNQQKLLRGSKSGFQAPTTDKWSRDLDAGEDENTT